MVSNFLLFVGYLCFFSYGFVASGTGVQSLSNLNSDASPVRAIQLPAFSSDSSSLDSDHTFANAEKIKMHSALAQEEVDDGFDVEDYEDFKVKPTKVVGLKHQSAGKEIRPMDSVLESTAKDLNGIQTLHTSIVERKKQNIISRILLKDDSQQQAQSPSFVANSDTAGALGYGMMVFSYGDSSKDTVDSAHLRMACRKSESWKEENVMFRCGYWNRDILHGAAEGLGFGRDPLSYSISSQLQSFYGDSFSYYLVDRNGNTSSRLIFGEDKDLQISHHPGLNFTTLIARKESSPVNTFYYVPVMVGREELINIPEETWNMSWDGIGGRVIDLVLCSAWTEGTVSRSVTLFS